MPIYLDHAATTPLVPEAREAIVAALDLVGNPSSIHSQGQDARRVLEEAREAVAASLDADPVEVTFTSGGTESINLAVKGLHWRRQADAPRPVVLAATGEHHATADAVEWLERHEGAEVEWLPIDSSGVLSPSVLAEALARHEGRVSLVTFLWANNEVGTVQPVRALVEVAAAHDVPVHVDAVSAYGYVPVGLHASGAAAISVSAHKIGGPVGVGALLLARRWEVEPLIHGGAQQRARSGTQDVVGAAGFAAAARALAMPSHASFVEGLAALRDRLIAGLRAAVPDAVLRGPDPADGDRLPGNVHATFPGAEGDSLLFLLDMAGFSVSTGSACTAGVPETSHVLLAMGVPEDDARGALRFTLGHGTTAADVDALVAALPAAYASARAAGLAAGPR
ncbi:cysteine desulfurase [Cnuibacter physcomitrellae]|uniref:Cysteine desulfurase NifS n=1 Tax=Cnuibacter physcomitrellae TaxID=1619308 RepID=A0A1X9LI72_9MICO|nr:cysteine desulfurase family protein [Cnuibacter physcomitrellae]ARJ04863.1 cysteine desulfurase NifS [Cnuibacter physcomitrellae]GGI41706.1 cysteine desulfurase [Cnuibacter physcomitrellae]